MMNMLDVSLTKGSRVTQKLRDGWTYSGNFQHYQKVNNKVYVYVTPQMFGRWVAQMYGRGETGFCSLEARVEDNKNVEKLFLLAEKWLEKYGEGREGIEQDPYYPFQNNWQGRDITDKELLY